MNNFVSIIAVNYNGKRYLEDFLSSVAKLDYSKDEYETIVVDNGSSDGSVAYLKESYPWVKIIEAGKNLGFGMGNNLGIKHAKGGLVLLLNNDTLPDNDLLKNLLELYKSILTKVRVGAINCKMVFADKYFCFRVKNAVLSKVITNSYKPINDEFQKMVHEDSRDYFEYIYIPCGISPGSGKITVSLSKLRHNDFSIEFGNNIIQKRFVTNKDCTVKISLKKPKFVDLIQNAGNYYFRDGYGRDRGVVVYSKRQFYEEDKGQYDIPEEIPGFCGAGVLLNKRAFQKVNGFDENFFMYYEDGDLSFRLKKKGYKIYYCPSALVRHVHAGSSKEWSNLFLYHVERGRLLFLSKHWPILVALGELFKYLIKDTLLAPLYFLYHSRKVEAKSKLFLRIRVIKSVFVKYILNLFGRDRMTYKEYYKLL